MKGMEERKKEKGERNKERNRRKVGKNNRKKERKKEKKNLKSQKGELWKGSKEENITPLPPPPPKKVSSDSPLTEISVPRFSFTTETTSLASN